ncbi:hypothetical protein PVA45_07720 (plasmid) [Entomospira entomophila]|uniref:Uncharacterized protein n=1 Tax=Entomospira entomophila TaxID=2719988 RepID=A0A968GB29_9SPIO|nr:hypothetical protein [Entomospira entomophilus]NIZ41391.1 hypothetical protein [Entomospira entomophilus]WDI36341.1 hypothetical protein PVA45_07720 [Entomospira entomophilus]
MKPRFLIWILCTLFAYNISAYQLYEPYEVYQRLEQYQLSLESSNFATSFNFGSYGLAFDYRGHMSIENPAMWIWLGNAPLEKDKSWSPIPFQAEYHPRITTAPVQAIDLYEHGITFIIGKKRYAFLQNDGRMQQIIKESDLGAMIRHVSVNAKQSLYEGHPAPAKNYTMMGIASKEGFLLYNVEDLALHDHYDEDIFIRTTQHVYYRLHLPTAQLYWLSPKEASLLGLRWATVSAHSVWIS